MSRGSHGSQRGTGGGWSCPLGTSSRHHLGVQGEESGFRDLSSQRPCQSAPMDNQRDLVEGMPLQTLIFLRGTRGSQHSSPSILCLDFWALIPLHPPLKSSRAPPTGHPRGPGAHWDSFLVTVLQHLGLSSPAPAQPDPASCPGLPGISYHC